VIPEDILHGISVQVQRQYSQAPEGVAARVTATLVGIPVHISDESPSVRGTLPIGSVEFVREGLQRQGARLPAPIDYPQSLCASCIAPSSD